MATNVWGADVPTVLVGALREVVVATAGQTVFSIGTFVYTLGDNELAVYVNGVRQYDDAYVETTTSSVTFAEGLEAGDKVLFEVNGG